MNHIHLNSTPSTQDYLLAENKQPKEGTLVSCDKQTTGKGQYDRAWKYFEGSLCFSFTLRPNKILTLSSLEIPILLRDYFLKNYSTEILFKWPNDLMNTEGKKIGGILINRHGDNDLVIGVGLNLWPIDENQSFHFKASSLFKDKKEFSSKTLSSQIYQYILNHRLAPSDVISHWNKSCLHINKEVSIKENQKSHTGIFKGIGDNGQALLSSDQTILEIYTGSLFF